MNILVLCTGNSARSILLEGILKSMGYASFSAGSSPTDMVQPWEIRTLAKHGITLDAPRSKSWDEFAKPGDPEMDLVVTVCGNAADEVCPVWPGAPLPAHWGVEDPAHVPEDTKEAAFEDAYQELLKRAMAFDLLDKSSITQAELNKIGQME